MKLCYLLFILLIGVPALCCAQLRDNPRYDQDKMLQQAQDALMSYEIVQKKTDYWEDRLERMIMGEYTEKLLILAPIVSGKVEFNAMDMNFYIDARRERSGVRYTHRF